MVIATIPITIEQNKIVFLTFLVLAKLKQLDYIKQVGKSIFVGEATEVSENNAKTICDIVWADSESWNDFLRSAYTKFFQCPLR